MSFDKLDFVRDHGLFLDFLEYQYGEYLESEREALIDSLKTCVAVIHVEPLGSSAAYSAYALLPRHLERLQALDKELIYVGGYLDTRPDPDLEVCPEQDPEPEWDQEAEENEEKDTYETRTDQEPRVEPEGDLCPVCGAPGYIEGECRSCGFDEAEGIECPLGLIRPLEDLEKCKGCASYKRKYGPKPALCNWNHWILEPEAFKTTVVKEAIAQ